MHRLLVGRRHVPSAPATGCSALMSGPFRTPSRQRALWPLRDCRHQLEYSSRAAAAVAQSLFTSFWERRPRWGLFDRPANPRAVKASAHPRKRHKHWPQRQLHTHSFWPPTLLACWRPGVWSGCLPPCAGYLIYRAPIGRMPKPGGKAGPSAGLLPLI